MALSCGCQTWTEHYAVQEHFETAIIAALPELDGAEVERELSRSLSVTADLVCNGCGRFSWSGDDLNVPCLMTQPNGKRCTGAFVKAGSTGRVDDEVRARLIAGLAKDLDMPVGLLDDIVPISEEALAEEHRAVVERVQRAIDDAVEVANETILRPALEAAGLDPDRYRLAFDTALLDGPARLKLEG